MNAKSSRSHAIVRVSVESREVEGNMTPGLVALNDVCQWVQDART